MYGSEQIAVLTKAGVEFSTECVQSNGFWGVRLLFKNARVAKQAEKVLKSCGFVLELKKVGKSYTYSIFS